jgi:hypothetical protein
MSRTASYPLKVSVKDKCQGVGVAEATVKMLAVAATVRLDQLTQVYDGQNKPVAVTTDPSNVSVEVTYDGSPTPPINAGTYAVVATVTDPQYVGSASGMLTVERAPVQVQLGGLTGQTYDGSARSATVSTLPGGVAVAVTYDGSAAPPVNAGRYAVAADVTDPNHQGSARGTLVVAKARATLSLDQLEHVYDGSPKTARATTSPSGLGTVTVLYDGAGSAPVGAGSYTVSASLSSVNYEAEAAAGTMVVRKATQSLSFAPLPPRTYGDAPFAFSARGGASTSPVTFALGTSSVGCAVAGATLTVTGATPEGRSCVVVARQSGDANYEAAPDVVQAFTIAKATPRVQWTAPATVAYGTALGSAELNASATGVGGSVLAGSFAYSPAAGTVLPVGTNNLTATFTPADAANYHGATAAAVVRVLYLTSPGHVFTQPLNGRTTINRGPKVRYAFQLFRADGTTPVSGARATMVVQPISPTGALGAAVPLSIGSAFVYDAREAQYGLELDTKDVDVGTFRVRAVLDDGSEVVGELVVTQGRGKSADEATTATPTATDHGKPKVKKEDKKEEPRAPIIPVPGGKRRGD